MHGYVFRVPEYITRLSRIRCTIPYMFVGMCVKRFCVYIYKHIYMHVFMYITDMFSIPGLTAHTNGYPHARYACIYVCMYTHICMYIMCICVRVCVYIYIYTHTPSLLISLAVCVYTYIHTHIHTHTYCIYTWKLYIYIYIYIYIYYLHVCVYMSVCVCVCMCVYVCIVICNTEIYKLRVDVTPIYGRIINSCIQIHSVIHGTPTQFPYKKV